MSSTRSDTRPARRKGPATTKPVGDGAMTAPAQPRPGPRRIRDLPTMRAGEAHPGVVLIQRYLRRFGHLPADEPVQEGRLDGPTAEALRRFQRRRRIPETGAFDEATRAEMARPVCGTPHPPRSGSVLKATVGHWDRRDSPTPGGRRSALLTTHPAWPRRSASRKRSRRSRLPSVPGSRPPPRTASRSSSASRRSSSTRTPT
jgi:hypothetical protein